MDNPTPIETFTCSLDSAFPAKYPVFYDEEEEINFEGLRDDFDTPFDAEANRNRIEDDTTTKKKKTKTKSRTDNRLAKRTSKILSNYRAFLRDCNKDIPTNVPSDPSEDRFPELRHYKHKSKNRTPSNRDKRTSKILSNYRDFLSDCNKDIPTNVPSDPSEDGFPELCHYKHKSKNLTLSNCDGDRSTDLIRDFSVPAFPRGSSDDGTEERKRYQTPSSVLYLYSKRVKYGVIMSFGLLLIIVVIVGITARDTTRVKIPTRQNTAGQHSEATYILEHENRDAIGKSPHNDIIDTMNVALPEPMEAGEEQPFQITKHITENSLLEETSEKDIEDKAAATEAEPGSDLDSASTQTSREPEIMSAATGPEVQTENRTGTKSAPTDADTSAADEVATMALESLMYTKYKPIWLGRSQGWKGGSHTDAMQFCQSIQGKELCPFSAMCPRGPGGNVMAGRRSINFTSEGEQYAPVYGHANRWIMVGRKNGDASTTCMSHEQLEMKPPSWGLNGDRPEVKSHIMCCLVPE